MGRVVVGKWVMGRDPIRVAGIPGVWGNWWMPLLRLSDYWVWLVATGSLNNRTIVLPVGQSESAIFIDALIFCWLDL